MSSWRQIYLFGITFYNNLDNIWVIWEHLLSLSFTYKSHANFLQQTGLNIARKLLECVSLSCSRSSGLLICFYFLCVPAPVGFELWSFCPSIQLLQLEVLVSKHQLLLICFNLAKNV